MKREPADIEAMLREHFRSPLGSCRQDALLLRHAAGELAPGERDAFEAHLSGCDECKTDLRLLEETHAVWRSAAPERRSLWERLWESLSVPRLAGAGAALALGVFLLVARPWVEPEEPLRPKGGWILHLAAKRDGRTFRVRDGEPLRTGDQLGLFYSSAEPGYLIVFYADTQGGLVRIFPALRAESARIEPGTEASLPDGVVLEPGEGCEWIIGLFSPRPFPAIQAEQTLREMISQRQGCTLIAPPSEGMAVQVHRVPR
jgi:hypothetical protein